MGRRHLTLLEVLEAGLRPGPGRSPHGASSAAKWAMGGLFLLRLFFLLLTRLGGLLGRLFFLFRLLFLLAEDGVVALGKLLGFGQSHANDAHGSSFRCDLFLGEPTDVIL